MTYTGWPSAGPGDGDGDDGGTGAPTLPGLQGPDAALSLGCWDKLHTHGCRPTHASGYLTCASVASTPFQPYHTEGQGSLEAQGE